MKYKAYPFEVFLKEEILLRAIEYYEKMLTDLEYKKEDLPFEVMLSSIIEDEFLTDSEKKMREKKILKTVGRFPGITPRQLTDMVTDKS